MAIVGDATRLRQILVNLLTNAVKFTEDGEVVLSVDSERIAEGDSSGAEICELHFAVRDTGIGIPKERIDRLFHSFSQVDASTTRRYGGTGLGLAISKRLSELMGGTMWVESEVGKGSVFHFTIKAETAGAAELDAPREHPQLRGKRLLVVADNAVTREVVKRQASAWGMMTRETGHRGKPLSGSVAAIPSMPPSSTCTCRIWMASHLLGRSAVRARGVSPARDVDVPWATWRRGRSRRLRRTADETHQSVTAL